MWKMFKLTVLWTFGLVFKLSVLDCSLTGFYVDNEHGQTVMYEGFTPADQREMEEDFLALLGLPDVPVRPRHVHHPSLKKSAPKFLLQIYQQLTELEEPQSRKRWVRAADPTQVDLKTIGRSDVIMTFPIRNQNADRIRHSNGYRLSFDLNRIKENNVTSALGVWLRIFNALGRDREEYREFSVRVFRIGAESRHHLVAVTKVSGHHEGWLEFQLTKLFRKDTLSNMHKLHLYISAESNGHSIKLSDIGLATNNDVNHQPFLVGFFKGTQTVSSKAIHKSHQRFKRSLGRGMVHNQNPLLYHRVGQPTNCHVRSLYVSFKDLALFRDWIVAPESYFASFCSGDCNFPLNAHMNATNHAIVQTLVHLMTPTKAPKPCCAPTKLYSISILYYLPDNSVNIKKFKNMVVKSCGCQ